MYKEGFLGDDDLGELHEKFSGGEETRNIISKNYEIGERRFSRSERNFIKKDDDERGMVKEPDFLQSIVGDKYSTYERVDTIVDSFFGTKKPSKPQQQTIYSDHSRDKAGEIDYCPTCGEEYDGIYCENCDDDSSEEDEEDEYPSKENEKEELKKTNEILYRNHLSYEAPIDNYSEIEHRKISEIEKKIAKLEEKIASLRGKADYVTQKGRDEIGLVFGFIAFIIIIYYLGQFVFSILSLSAALTVMSIFVLFGIVILPPLIPYVIAQLIAYPFRKKEEEKLYRLRRQLSQIRNHIEPDE